VGLDPKTSGHAVGMIQHGRATAARRLLVRHTALYYIVCLVLGGWWAVLNIGQPDSVMTHGACHD
jgi:hypothetical protein